MDTVPFHFMMFALDLVLWLGIAFWLTKKSPGSFGRENRHLDLFSNRYSSMETENDQHKPKGILRDILGVLVLAGIGVVGIAVFAFLFRTNRGQCLVEGLTYHGSVFLWVAAFFLFRKSYKKTAVLAVLSGLMIFVLGFDMLVWEPTSLVVEHYTIETDKVKKPLKIVFVADIQTDRIGRHERRTLEMIQEQNADLILLGGDYLQYYPGTHGTEDLPERFAALFREIPLSAPLGVFAICGNIDPASHREFYDLFKDSSVEACFDSEIIENLGVDHGLGPVDLVLLSMADSIDGVEENARTETGNFIVVAGHYPVYAIKDYQHSKWAPDLMFAGHTHGGQFALPFYGPVRIKFTSREKLITRKFLSGMHTFSNGGQLLVTRGSGMERGWAPRVRFFCRPEISVVHVVPKN